MRKRIGRFDANHLFETRLYFYHSEPALDETYSALQAETMVPGGDIRRSHWMVLPWSIRRLDYRLTEFVRLEFRPGFGRFAGAVYTG